jgi:hypothetical protein
MIASGMFERMSRARGFDGAHRSQSSLTAPADQQSFAQESYQVSFLCGTLCARMIWQPYGISYRTKSVDVTVVEETQECIVLYD